MESRSRRALRMQFAEQTHLTYGRPLNGESGVGPYEVNLIIRGRPNLHFLLGFERNHLLWVY